MFIRSGLSFIIQGLYLSEVLATPPTDVITVPIVPPNLRHPMLQHSHSAGHQSIDRTLHQLQQESYWSGMATDVVISGSA